MKVIYRKSLCLAWKREFAVSVKSIAVKKHILAWPVLPIKKASCLCFKGALMAMKRASFASLWPNHHNHLYFLVVNTPPLQSAIGSTDALVFWLPNSRRNWSQSASSNSLAHFGPLVLQRARRNWPICYWPGPFGIPVSARECHCKPTSTGIEVSPRIFQLVQVHSDAIRALDWIAPSQSLWSG